jgi:hypothetical protein
MADPTLRDAAQAVIDWCDLVAKHPADFESERADANLRGPLFDELREALAAQPSAGAEPVAWKAKAAVLRMRGKNNSLHDINQAADYLDQAASFTRPAPVLAAREDAVDAAWTELCEVDDRTSPEDYPEMCLITRDELADFMGRSTPVQPDSGGVVEALREALEKARDHYDMLTRLANGGAVYEVSPDTGKRTRRKLSEVIASECDAASKHCRAALAPVAAEGGVSHREKYQMIRDGGMSEHDLECSIGEGHTVAAIYAALEPFAEAARLAEVSGRPPSSFVGATEFERAASALRTEPTGGGEVEDCPICAVTFKPDDLCATDITEGTCHAACLKGSPIVDLETGGPTKASALTYRYDSALTGETGGAL